MHYPPAIAPSPRYHPPTDKDDGRWLCADGPYLDYINSACALQPCLRLPDARNRAVPLRQQSARATLLSFGGNSRPSRTDFSDPTGLKDHFAKLEFLRHRNAGRKDFRNVYLLEGLNPEFISILGKELRVDPTFFVSHERTSTYLGQPYESSLVSRLPSLASGSEMFSASYYDIRAPDQLFDSFNVGCAQSGRDVLTNRFGGEWEHAVVLNQKCSVWKTSFRNNDDWSVLILCDPPFQNAHIWTQRPRTDTWHIETVDVTSTPFQGGYLDFVPRPFSLGVQPGGPERQGLYGDLCYYMTECTQELPNGLKSPSEATVFVKKIIASQYMQLIEYHGALISNLRSSIQRTNNSKSPETVSLETKWSDIQLVSSRCDRYIKDVSSIMLQLGIPYNGLNPTESKAKSWIESQKDFQYIHTQLKLLKQRAEFLNESLISLSGIIGGARALKEARKLTRETKTVKTLTFVAMVFVPLAFTTGLLACTMAIYLAESGSGSILLPRPRWLR